MKKGHTLLKGTKHFSISERLREQMCLLGQSVVYEEASEVFKELLDLKICAVQIQRVCVYYGNLVEPLIKRNCEAVLPQLNTAPIQDDLLASPKQSGAEPTYVMVDGSMIFTRPNQWRELKLGRMFQASKVVNIHEKRRSIMESIYVGYLGSVEEFLPKLERHLVGYKNKVIIGDGARWIWNWVEDNYPGATQILDFYHAKEKLVLFAKHQYKNEELRQNWIRQQCEYLLNDGVEIVLTQLKNCRARNTEAKEAKQKLLDYYIEHEDRMLYKTYKDKGLMIGSGPIEAAHRSVIQQRLKLSGQKWSEHGAQAITNLRCYRKSNAWEIIKDIIAKAA